VHIVEELIAERAPKLMSKPRLFKVIKPPLYKMLAYESAVELADTVEPLTGRQAFTQVTDLIQPRTSVEDMSNLPETGACIVIANHPTGLADGLAVFHAIREQRPEHVFLANADALRVIPKGEDIIIPVEWVKAKRNHAKARDTLLNVRAALKEGRCVVIFPSGALAKMSWRGLIDRPWQSSAAMLARKYKAPVIPLKIKARNSVLYYVLSAISGELRDITLFYELLNKKRQTFLYELLNKKRQTFRMKFGTAIPPESISKNADIATADIRKIVESL